MTPGTAQHLLVGQGLPRGTQGGCRRLQEAAGGYGPLHPSCPIWTQSTGSYSPPEHCCPRASLLLPWGRQSWSPHSPAQWHTAPPCHDFSSPKFFWQLSSCLQPAQPSAAGGSERRRGHHWGPRACCGQATARLSAASRTHHVQPQHGSRESRGMERGGVGQAGGGRLAGVAMGTGVLQTPAPPGSCNPGAEGWQWGGSGGLEQGNPQQTVRTTGPSCSPQQFWKSNWKPLTTLRGHSCTGGGDARGPQRNRERAPEGWGAPPGCRRPWVCKRALHPRGNAANRAACRVLHSIQLCSAVHKKWCKVERVRLQTPKPGWGLRPCRASSSEGGRMHLRLPKAGLQSRQSQDLLQNISILGG